MLCNELIIFTIQRQNDAREEEKRKREDAQKKKEFDEEKRKKQAAQAFSKFFVPKRKADTPVVDDDTSKDIAECADSAGVKSYFMPFQVRERMMVAPCVRLQIEKEKLKALEDSLKSGKSLAELYIHLLKSGAHKPISTESTWPMEDKEDDDIVVIGKIVYPFIQTKIIIFIFIILFR